MAWLEAHASSFFMGSRDVNISVMASVNLTLCSSRYSRQLKSEFHPRFVYCREHIVCLSDGF